MAEFVLRTHDIKEDGTTLTYEVRPAWLAAQLEGTDLSADSDGDPGVVELTATKSGADVVLRGEVRARLIAPCARCLFPVVLDLAADMTTLMTAMGAGLRPEPDEDDTTPEELAREYFHGDEIVLDELVRENLILEVPMQVHCTQPECVERWEPDPGSRPPRMPDPRFAALATFKEKLGKD